MDWFVEGQMAMRAIIAALLGAMVGYERERTGQVAGVRTYAAVSLGACIFGLVSSHVGGAGLTPDTRIASNVVTGVGFLGAGVILRDQGRVVGLTTAATLWSAASFGLAIAFGMYVLGTLTAVLVLLVLLSHHLPFLKRVRMQAAQRPPDDHAPQQD